MKVYISEMDNVLECNCSTVMNKPGTYSPFKTVISNSKTISNRF